MGTASQQHLMTPPLVSVVTPTWQRNRLLLSRCIPSVQAQDYPAVEHVVVSDGPDPDLGETIIRETVISRMESSPVVPVVFADLPSHDPVARWGHRCRLRGIELASGDLIAWLDDDNAFRPQHVSRLAAALEADPAVAFAFSQIAMHGHGDQYVVGAAPPCCGQIDTSAIMCRRSALDVATWRDQGQQTIDWDLVDRWMAAGLTWAFVNEVTADYYFT
jgi:glycosyltransferase involved in cell wall biosynthesis